MTEHDMTFRAMGSDIRLLVAESPAAGAPAAARAAREAREWIAGFDARLSRFREDSELTALNRDPRPAVPASPLLRAAVAAGLWAARRTGGLVDPTVCRALEAAGYAASRDGVAPAPLADALAAAPPRRPARPDPAATWRAVSVDERHGLVRRPPGVALDTGGSGKGLAADALAHRLAGRPRFAVDCGGDVRVGGAELAAHPYEIEVRHPMTGEHAHTLRLAQGAVATSGIDVRLWRRADGRFAHHLIDPSTGEPAWTGLVGVTALGATALEAETLAKAALLSGPAGARELLSGRGGLLVHEDGDVELAGPLRERPVVRLRGASVRAAA